MDKPCIVFEMNDEKEAMAHIYSQRAELINRYGEYDYGHWMCGGDGGWREIIRCKVCGGLYLVQRSEIHYNDGYAWREDYFPVSSVEEAEDICEKIDGEELIDYFNERFLRIQYGRTPFWCYGFSLSKEQRNAIKEKYGHIFSLNL